MYLILLLSIILLILIFVGLKTYVEKKQKEAEETIEAYYSNMSNEVHDIYNEIEDKADQIGLDVSDIAEGATTVCAWPRPCLNDNFFLNDNGCCELKSDRTLSKREQDILMGLQLTQSVVESLIINKVLEGALKVGGKFLDDYAQKKLLLMGLDESGMPLVKKNLANRIGSFAKQVTFKTTSMTGKAMTKISSILGSSAFTVIDVASVIMDIFDVGGYQLFQPNSALEQMQKYLDVQLEKICKQSGLDYPILIPLDILFGSEYETAYTMAYDSFLANMEETNPEYYETIFNEMMKFLDSEDESISESSLTTINEKQLEAFNLDPVARDKQIFNNLKEILGSDEDINLCTEFSTENRIGISLSESGLKKYNREIRNRIIYPNPDDIVFVGVWRNYYNTLNLENPGKENNPNVTKNNISKFTAIGTFYAPIYNICENYLEKTALVKGAQPDVNPYNYGVIFNDKTGTCKYTKDYCTRMGMNFVESENDCKTLPGIEVAEFIFGDTLTSGAIHIANTLGDSYTRGPPKLPECSDTQEKKGLLCYDKCPSGYKSRALQCAESCQNLHKDAYDSGFGTCILPRHAEVQWPCKCNGDNKVAYGKALGACTCTTKCPDSSWRRGSWAHGTAFCDKKIDFYSRFLEPSEAKSCDEDKEYSMGFCYPKCKENYYGVGPVCYPCTGLTNDPACQGRN